ncbi:Uu.00g073670.m01.CDS01 [Anthostomella pinea]|uniref:Uu.00g073670.m01.CDS01 n=1 Tax=Anthostomella pinea TaxID=933095 RepID=A0AAI8VVA4_9PEZI|nr:Uu.00g073670.m01.CDS01 [Anthostomella pinea]
MLLLLLLASLTVTTVRGNTEKAIFLGPPAANISSAHPTLDDLNIDTLTPQDFTVRTHLEAQFPSDAFEYGKATWLVLDELTEGQRYEVRVCWAATQPTAFRMNTYELQTVFETPELISDLSEYSRSRQPAVDKPSGEKPGSAKLSGVASASERQASVLLLQVLAAADYYTMNKTLMRDVPPVHVDIILDPFLLNVLPRSLAPTVIYIIVVAIASWFLAQLISTKIRQIPMEPSQKKSQ